MTSDLPLGWESVALSDLIKIHHGFAFKGQFFRDHGPDDVLLTPGNFAVGGGFLWAKRKYYSGPVDDRFVLAPGDLIITMTDLSRTSDTLGSPAIVPPTPDGSRLLHNQRLGRVEILAPERVCAPYLYAALRTRAYRRQIVATATGTTVKHTSPGRIGDVRIPLPPPSEQERIAATLGRLERKIDSNRRLAALLKQTAHELFRARFVDFVGVSEPFDDSELGPIPQGWRPATVEDLTERMIGGVWGNDAPSAKTPIAVRCLRGIDVHELAVGGVPDPPIRYVSTRQLEKRRLAPGDILIEGSGSFCGRSGLYQAGWQLLYAEELTYSNFCKRLRPAVDAGQAAILWLHLSRAYELGQTALFRTGSAFPNLDIDGLCRSVQFAMPPEPDTDAFVSFFRLAYGTTLRKESKALLSVRDALLPKLISGEIRVPDAADADEIVGMAREIAATTS